MKFGLVLVVLIGCGTVTADPSDGGAGGSKLGTGGGAGGGSGAAAGAAGSPAGQGGSAGAAELRPWTAPTCVIAGVPGNPTGTSCLHPDGSFEEITVDGGVPGSGVDSWRCEQSCSYNGQPTPTPCTTATNHVYCVASCTDCPPFMN